jgi:hypothetical protein
MNRLLFLLVALAIAIVGCTQSADRATDMVAFSTPAFDSAPASGSAAVPAPATSPPAFRSPAPSARPTGQASTSPAPASGLLLAANGSGPYRVGASLSDLRSRGLIRNVADSVNCGEPWKSAEATGRYAGRLVLAFESGRLTDVATASTALVTPSGAKVGMTLQDLQRIYGNRGKVIESYSSQAFSVRVAGTKLGIVFYFEATDTHPTDPKVNAISAGEVERLEQAAIVGEGC